MPERLPIVAVLGSGEYEHAEKAEPLGAWLAGEGVHLLTGAGRGVMLAASRGFTAIAGRAGLAIGIVPSSDDPSVPAAGYPNAYVELPIFTHLPLRGSYGAEPMSRNHINVLTANVLIALPGSAGTASEVHLALAYRRPIIAFLNDRSDIPGLPGEVVMVTTLDEVKAFVRRELASQRG